MRVAAALTASTHAATILRCALLALLYFVAARASLDLAIPPGYATPVWPPSGIAVGALLIWGRRLWPGIWLGAAAVNYTVNQVPGLAAWIATGNTLEALAAVWFMRRFANPPAEFRRPEDVVIFGIAAAASALLGASIAVAGLVAFKLLGGDSAMVNGFTWWLGDTAGIVLLAPLLLAWTRPEPAAPRRTSFLEASIFCGSLLLVTALVLAGEPAEMGRRPGAFALVVLAVWAGSRFQERTITSVSLLLVGLAVWATAIGRGPFALDDVNDALLYLQAFACSVALVGLALHALRRQRDDPAVQLLRLREAQLAEAQRLAGIGSWHWDIRRKTVAWSDELFRILGRAPGTFTPSYEAYLAVVHPDDRTMVEKAVHDAVRAGTPFSHEYRAQLPDGTIRHLHARGFVDRDGGGTPVALHGTCQDVTERRDAERLHREAEERFRTLVEHVHDYAIFILDAEGRVASWNRGAERIKGYRAEEILGRHLSAFYPPEQGAEQASRNLRTAVAEGRFDSEDWRIRKDGTRFWAHATITALKDDDGEVRGYAKVTRDINDRKRAEEDLRSYANRLMSTSRRLLEVQEAEKRRLAGELHDRVGPNLTALGMKLELLDGHLSAQSPAAVGGLIEDSKALLQETVAAARAVMGELRPQVLVDYGLVAALRAMAGGFSRRTGIDAAVEGVDGANRLPQTVELAFFRIAQEALNNIGKHSRARSVSMRYAESGGLVTLDIDDDGIGFDRGQPEENAADAGWGLIIMRERAEAVGARFSLATNPGQGVRVRVAYRT
jgi:PAS domain S-box-containing protein